MRDFRYEEKRSGVVAHSLFDVSVHRVLGGLLVWWQRLDEDRRRLDDTELLGSLGWAEYDLVTGRERVVARDVPDLRARPGARPDVPGPSRRRRCCPEDRGRQRGGLADAGQRVVVRRDGAVPGRAARSSTCGSCPTWSATPPARR